MTLRGAPATADAFSRGERAWGERAARFCAPPHKPAWVNRDRPARATTIGIWVALTGALVGALLGFNATSGLMAVITTIVGAAAGANLGLIALDVARIGERPETVPPIAIPTVEH